MSVAGQVPDENTPWPLFLAIAERGGRFEARRMLGIMDGVYNAIGRAFSENGNQFLADRMSLKGIAYPNGR